MTQKEMFVVKVMLLITNIYIFKIFHSHSKLYVLRLALNLTIMQSNIIFLGISKQKLLPLTQNIQDLWNIKNFRRNLEDQVIHIILSSMKKKLSLLMFIGWTDILPKINGTSIYQPLLLIVSQIKIFHSAADLISISMIHLKCKVFVHLKIQKLLCFLTKLHFKRTKN